MEPNFQRHSTTSSDLNSLPRLTNRTIFSHLFTPILTFSWSGGALPPMSPLQQQKIRIPLHALSILPFFPPFYIHFNFYLKRRSLTFKDKPTLPSDSDSTPRFTYPAIFTHLSTSILTFSCSVGALPPTSPLWKHQFRIRLLAVPTIGFFPPLWNHFNFFLKRWSLTSKVTPTAISNSDSTPRDTHHCIFFRLSTAILTFSWRGGA